MAASDRGRRRRHGPYVPPPWEYGVDLVALTARYAVEARVAPALNALLKSRKLDDRALAPASGLDRKYLKAILAGRSTPTPETIDDIISGFSLRGGGLLAPEMRA